MESLWGVWVLSSFSVFWGSQKTTKNQVDPCFRCVLDSGRIFGEFGPFWVPKRGPGGYFLEVFGGSGVGLNFGPMFRRFFYKNGKHTKSQNIEFYCHAQCFVRVAGLEKTRGPQQTCKFFFIEKTRKIDGKSIEKPAQNGYPHRGIKKTLFFTCFSLSGPLRGDFGVQPGSLNFTFFWKVGSGETFFFLFFRVALHVL